MTSNKKVNRISSSTLFHFTKSFDSLVGILENGLNPSFVLEKIKIKDKILKSYVLMVSFCDIPLSLSKNYMTDRYGCYGIGLPKNWGESYGTNPVLYLKPDSNLAAHIGTAFEQSDLNNNPNLNNLLLSVLDHSKPYGGHYKFYDEKEWRYIPEITDPSLILLAEDSEEKKKSLEKRTKKFAMKFKPEQIRYIIVEKNSDIPKMIKAIKKRYKYEKVGTQGILFSKIITFKQMREDF